MATILESLTQALSSSATKDLGSAVGLKPDLVSKGLGVVGPLVTTALANKASTPGGVADLMQLLPKDGTSSLLGNLAGLIGSGVGAKAVSSIFGGGAGAIGATLDRSLGFKASSLLPIVAPLVLGLISKVATEKKLDSTGVANLLSNEAAEFQKTGGETARLVRETVATGRQAADIKAKYSDVQWESVRLAPVAAASVIMMADKSGVVGATKEISAASSVIDDAKKTAAPTSVLSLAFESELSVDELSKYVKGRTPADALETVREAIDVVERNSPADASNFRRLVADVATSVANASKEGGFLGIGGTLVSSSEQAALDQLRTVIGDR
jgi:hypothetical protein